ncbi:SGNH family hydrolase [uncultured Methylobacterium sp.]|uniref:SGNH/GDSL hydrolase family protein n=1 Tax=uncultured Methylobacterium sp. TaxID=157278 RepID=UPI00260B6F3B|nr:SGNH family hydrolase [uncultured Methylobacterium sp.]
MRRLACGVALLAFGSEARAQWGGGYGGDGYPPPRRAPDGYGTRGGYDERAYRRPAPPPPEAQRQFYWPWEDRPAEPPQYAAPPPASGGYRTPRPRPPREAQRPHDGRSVQRPKPKPAPVVAKPPAVKPKTNPTTQIAVFGDSLAELLAQGLDNAYESSSDVVVIRRAKGDSGLVRKDVVDWPKAAEDYLKQNPKLTYAVVMLGANDRQPLRDGDQSVEAMSERWRALYRDRVDALLKVFSDAKVPVVWVGAPPMKSETLSADMTSLNEIYRDRVQRAGGVYVDVWPAFVDDANRYAASGPDLEGQTARLRTSDGVHFTGAGARKVAHFADVEIRRLMEARGGVPASMPDAVAAAPSPGGEAPRLDDDAAIDRLITAMLPSLPEPPGIPALPVKPAAGPVLPLTRTEVAPGAKLLSGRPRVEGDAGYTVERSLTRGAAPPPQPGRADDFRWPRL